MSWINPELSMDMYERILGAYPDDLKKGMRIEMTLSDVIQSYPELSHYLKKLIVRKYNGEDRARYYPYELSVLF